VHMASVWVPFTSESKEALAHYTDIMKEIRLALQDVGRQLMAYTNKKNKLKKELQKRSLIEKYIPHVADALKDLMSLNESDVDQIEEHLADILEKTRGTVKEVAEKNSEYDEAFANIGKENEESD